MTCNASERFQLDSIVRVFIQISSNKATRPDVRSAFLLKTCAGELSPPWQYLFQQSPTYSARNDNDLKYTTRGTKEWLHKKHFKVFEWPSQCPGLNLRENLWRELKVQAKSQQKPQYITALEQRSMDQHRSVAHLHFSFDITSTCRGLSDSSQ